MDEFLKTIKQKFSMENLIETIRDELDDPKKTENVKPNPVEKVKEAVENAIEDKMNIADKPTVIDNMTPSNLQKKQPSTNTANVLQKPNPPDEDNDPYQENENLFSFCD